MKLLPCGLLFFLIVTHSVIAKTYYFDASMLSGNMDNIDLSLFEEGGQLPGVYYVDIFLNGSRVESRELVFNTATDSEGKPYLKTCLTRDMLLRYGVKIEEYPTLFDAVSDINNIDSDENGSNTDCAKLTVIPQATEVYQFASQQLLLGIPQVALREKISGIAPEALWDDGISAFLINWQANANRVEGRGIRRSVSETFWASLQPGINVGPWRVRNLINWNKSSGNSGNWESIYTRAERGINSIKSRLMLGEDYTPSDIFDSIPFRGVMVSSDESMTPHNQREFSPIVKGIAYTQARIEVRQNGYLIQSQVVAPGEFSLTDLPLSTSHGDLEITVFESDGTTRVFSVPFTTPAIALREGYLKYNVTAGQYRPSDNSVEHSSLGQFTAMYGLPWGITVFGGMQVAEHYQSSALGIGVSLGHYGALSVDGHKTRSQQNKYDYEAGNNWRLRYNKTFEVTGTSFSMAINEYSSGYRSLSDVLGTYRNHNIQNNSGDYNRIQRTTLTLSQPLSELGYISIYGSRDKYRNRRENQDSIGASFSSSWGDIAWTVNWSRSNEIGGYSNRSYRQMEDNVNLWMSVPIGRFLGYRDNNINATSQMQYSSAKNTVYEIGVNGNAFDNRLYWDMREQLVSGSKTADSSRLNLKWYGTYGDFDAMYSYSRNLRQLSAGMSGGILGHAEGVTLGQRTSNTIALISAPGISGASVGGWPGIKTDFRGYTLAGYMTPYQENIITLDPTTFPDDAEVLQTDSRVVPTKGAIVRANFETRVGKRALLSLTYSNGKPLPFGSVVTVEGMNERSPSTGIVDDNGKVYMSGLAKTGRIKVQWGKRNECYAKYQLPEEQDTSGIFLTRAVCM
ncbi:fimbria/pilus outer membrane usher protein [Escherichia coli]|nr:fimbria/pilus outer membrane usher protein [Escherichia coli]